VWFAFVRFCGCSWSRRFAAVVSFYTRPLVRVYRGKPNPFNFDTRFVYRGKHLMARRFSHAAAARLAVAELEALRLRALSNGMRVSEYLRLLVLADLRSVTDDRLFQTVEAEHTRLALLTAQQGKPLNQATLRELRSQAIVNAPVLVEQTIRLLRQMRNGGEER